MPTFFERVRAALAPKGYQVERELGSGGMGIVVLARQTRLDRLVAVKVIRPELHTALATARFVREAQALASVPHPHIVQVFEADEADGLPYYVMQYLDGTTVEKRLRTSTISPREVLKLGRDLLDALEHAHAHGIVHRDVKPANVFWDGENAVLVDFGVARRLGTHDKKEEPLTEPGAHAGTRAYMTPEQLAGEDATPASDLYAAALVLYEAYTGRHWLEAQGRGAQARVWRGVPWLVRGVLRRGLAWKARDRWPEVATFKRRFWATRRRRYQWGAVGLVAVGLIVGTAVTGRASMEAWPFQRAAGLRLVVSAFDQECGAPANAGTRVARSLVRDLQGYADFSVSGPTQAPWFRSRSTVVVRGQVCAQGGAVRAAVSMSGGSNPTIVAHTDSGRLDALADTLSYAIVREIWNRENPFDPALPTKALPRSARGLAAWLVAERHFARARWGSADSAYAVAEAVDATCWLCAWRHAEVEKWIGRPFDETRATRYLSHIDSFPPHYQAVIRASRQPLVTSLATLKEVVRQRPAFLPALFMLADETYHRGPLIGRSRRDAIQALQAVAQVRPDFLPAAEHLTWAFAADGQDSSARAAFRNLEQSGPPADSYAQEVRALLSIGLVCRFEGRSRCRDALDVALARAGARQYPDLAAGPRYLMTFDAPDGAVDFGRRFAAQTDAPALVESGLVAELSGYLALGLPDSARLAAQALHGLGRPELTVLPAELAGVLLLLDPPQGDVRSQMEEITRGLVAHTHSSVSTAATRWRAAWMLMLLARRGGGVPDSSAYLRLLEGERGRRPLTTLLAADAAARQDRPGAALELTDELTPLQADSLGDPEVVDPFFRTVLHLFRADWYMRRQDKDGAERELRWYQNNDFGRRSGPPQVADVDWGFGSFARWRLARLLDGSDDRRACDLYRDVVRGWAGGDARYRPRADSAAARIAVLQCPPRA